MADPAVAPDPASAADDDAAAVIAWLRANRPGTLLERLGIEVAHADRSRVVGSMPVAGNTQPHGLLHGGASAALAETLGSIAASLHAGPNAVAVGIELSCTHHRAAHGGRVTGVATPISEGRTLATYAITVTDEAGALVCTSRLSCLIRATVPGKDGSGPRRV
ncbi:MAG: hotdog fold thioesterase [Actinomycetota bacterium]|nr:MAG: hotdog fold thioesterase [Actinomycetota bacterium]